VSAADLVNIFSNIELILSLNRELRDRLREEIVVGMPQRATTSTPSSPILGATFGRLVRDHHSDTCATRSIACI